MVLTNFYTRLRNTRFGRGRRFRRQAGPDQPEVRGGQEAPSRVEEVCPTRKHFIHPTVAYSVKGELALPITEKSFYWRYHDIR